MGEIDAAGDIVTGGLIGRAVEPVHGEAHGGPGALCLNCGTTLLGDYCHRCGQAGHIHRSLAAIWHDIAHGVLHFEGKIWRTLPLLVFRPGELTRRFIAGERARFVSPMALFLFSVFLMFAVISAVGSSASPGADSPAQDRTEALREFREEQAARTAELGRLESELARARAAGRPVAGLEGEIRGARNELAARERVFRLATGIADREVAGDARRADGSGTDGAERLNFGLDTGWKKLDEAMAKAEKNPSLFLYKLQSNAYKFSWALIPLSVPFVWLMFAWRRRYRAYDHAVFVTYSLSFMTLFVIALTLAGSAGASDGVIVAAVFVAPPLHMYKQLRHAYALGRASAAWRTAALLVFAGVVSLAFVLLLVALGLLG